MVIKIATIKIICGHHFKFTSLEKTDGMNLRLNICHSNSLVCWALWNKMQKILLMGKPSMVILLQGAQVPQKYLFPNDLFSRETPHDCFHWSRGLDIKEFASTD